MSSVEQQRLSSLSPRVIPLRRDAESPAKTPHALIGRHADPKALSSTWALDIRKKLDTQGTSDQELDNSLVSELTAELSAVFISALQGNSRHQWLYLAEVLRVCLPYLKYLEDDEQLRHYVSRAYFQTRQHHTPTAGSDIDSLITMLFPKTIMKLKSTGGDARDYRNPLTPARTPSITSPRFNPLSMSLPDGADPYTLERPGEEEKHTPRGINFGDIREVLPSIVMETVRHEAMWSDGLGMTAAAMNLDLNDQAPTPATHLRPQPAPPRLPDASWRGTAEDPLRLKEELAVSEDAESEMSEDIPLTGKEVVEMFGRGRHLGKAKFIYLNKTPTRHFSPYTLSVVPKHKADPEGHWIVSCFGVMHRVKGQPAEGQELYEWHREAVLWGILTKMPFFKHYLVRKAFKRWRAGQKHQEFCNIRKRVHESLLLAVPGFGAASLQVSKLLQELGTVRFLPLELNRCFTLPEYQHKTKLMFKAGQLILNKFFNFCKLILDKACQDSFDMLRFCEAQATKDKALFSKESLFVQRQKKEQRETNLLKAQEETKRLGNFVLLIDQMLVCHLLALTRYNICNFVHLTMSGTMDAQREALYRSKIVFTNKGSLVLSPSKKTFLDNTDAIFVALATLVSDAAKPMEEVTAGWVGDQREKFFTHGEEEGRSRSGASTQTGRSSRRKVSSAGADNLQEPIITEQETPRKESDYLGVKTPELCKKTDLQEDLVVLGERVVGQYNPLMEGSLADRLLSDEEISAAREEQARIIQTALEEIDEFCEGLSWLAEIHSFARKWTKDAVLQWKRAQAYTIEMKLGEIRDWCERVKNVEHGFVTQNGLFHVDCRAVQDDLVPLLNNAFRDLLTFTASEAKNLSMEFMTEIRDVVTGMKEKNADVKAFAEYAKQYTKYKIKMPELQKEVEYIKSMFEVIRLSYRSLTPEEEKCEEGVWQNWEAFLLQLQDAAEFVNMQTPIQIGNLDEAYQHLYSEAQRISSEASRGIYLDPSQNPMKVLDQLKVLFADFTSVTSRINECSQHRQKITGQSYDTAALTAMLQTMTLRSQLWKFVEATTFGIQEWKHMLFRKMNVAKAMTKVTDWQQAAGQLKDVLPQGDQVLAHWYRMLSDFKQDLPLLQKLSSDFLKSRHWKALFLALGQAYEPGRQYYVHELLSYDLTEHSMQINTICAGASAEFDLEQKLIKLRKVWEEKEFKLAKYIAPGKDTFDFGILNKKDGKKFEPAPDMYTLIGHQQLKYLLEDNQLTLQSMLVSPHLADLRPEADSWASTLRQVGDMLELWVVSQKKWLYLSQVFSDETVGDHQPDLEEKFKAVDQKYQEFITSIVGDPKVLSILSKRKGMKGYRELQGDVLAELLKTLSASQDDILTNLDPFAAANFSLERARHKYPRLHFLSNHEMIDLFSNSSDRQKWVPQVRALFPGIRSLVFEVPSSSDDDGIGSGYDLLLNADRLEVTAIQGSLGEHFNLLAPLSAKSSPPVWMRCLETSLKTTMGNLLHSCLESRLTEGLVAEDILAELSALEAAQQPTLEPSSVSDADNEGALLKEAVRVSFSHWLLRYPSQCVLTGEGVLWSREVQPAVKEGDKKQLTDVRDHLQRRLEQYSSLLRQNCQSTGASNSRARLQILLGSLIEQAMHHRDIMADLLKKDELSERDFDWRRILRYEMDFKTVLCALSVADESESETGRKSEASKSVMTLNDDASVTTDQRPSREAPIAPRTKTAIGTGYAFGPLRVTQLGARFSYDHEYLGPGPRLVATPLTDRCHLSLTAAMQQKRCGAVIGPSGVGKTETIKELAKFMGQNLVALDCAVDFSMVIVSQFLSGAVQTGSWLLLDNADRLTHGVMAVVSEQLQYLCQAYHILQNTHSVYSNKGASKHDYKIPESNPKRRHSLGTLHSLQVKDHGVTRRQKTFPSAPSERQGPSAFDNVLAGEEEECPVAQFGKRRHSISREEYFQDDHYDGHIKPVPLFLETEGPAMIGHKPVSSDDAPTDSLAFSPVQRWQYKPEYCGYVGVASRMVLANANYGCFMTLDSGDQLAHTIPDSLKSSMRPVAMVIPDIHIILETLLICNCFQETPTLAAKLCRLTEMLQNSFPDKPEYRLGLGTLKSVIHLATARLFSKRQRYQLSAATSRSFNGAARQSSEELLTSSSHDFISGLEQDDLHKEECALTFALQLCLVPRTPAQGGDPATLRGLLRCLFPWGMGGVAGGGGGGLGKGAEHDPVLVDAIQSQFVSDGLQATPLHVSKVLELYESLRFKSGVVLVGPAGSGKTVCYQTLCRVLNGLQTNPPPQEEGPTAPIHGPAVPGLEGLARHQLSQPMERLRRKAEVVSFMTLHWMDVATKGAEKPSYPRVDSSVIYPATLSDKQLIGQFDPDSQRWSDGLVTTLIYGSGQSMETAQDMQRELAESKKKKKNATKGLLNPPTVIHKWLLLDGVIDPRWAETLGGLIGDGRGMPGYRGDTMLSSGEKLPIADCTSLIFETHTVTTASPATLARCAVVHLGAEVVSWKSLVESWLSGAQQQWELNNNCLQLLQNLMDDTFSRTLEFLSSYHCLPALDSDLPREAAAGGPGGGGVVEGAREVGSFLRILTAMCDHHLMREKGDGNEAIQTSDPRLDERRTPRPTPTPTPTPSVSSLTRKPVNKLTLVTSMFTFAYVWGFGGQLHDRHAEMFDQFARQVLSRTTYDIILPQEGSVYDIHVDVGLGILASWTDANREKMRTINANFTVTPQAERYFHLLDILAGANQPVLLAGAPGVGKTALIQNMVQPRHHFLSLSMSSVMSCETMETTIVSKLRPRSTVTNNPQPVRPGQMAVNPLFFIDDLNCAGIEKRTGEQPCLEMLRQLMAEGSVYQRDSLSHYALEKVNFVGACQPPGHMGVGSGEGCHPISPRLARMFVVLTYFAPAADSLNLLHAGSLQSWLEEFPAYSLNHHYELAQALVKATVNLHDLVKGQLLTTPVNPHYVFSLHDVNRVIQGMFLMANRAGRSKGRHGRRGGGQRSQGKGASRSRKGRTDKKPQKEGPPPMMRTIIRLWCHEACRTYYDRIASPEDQAWFKRSLEELVVTHFCGGPKQKKMASPPVPLPARTEDTDSSQDQADSSHPSFTPPAPPSPTPTAVTDKTVGSMEEGSNSGRADTEVLASSTPLPPSTPSGTPLLVNGDGPPDLDDQSDISIASGSSLDVPIILKEDAASSTPQIPAIVMDPSTDTPQSPKLLQPVPPPPRTTPKAPRVPTPPSQPAVPPALKKDGEESKTKLGGQRRGVTFKPGLILDDGNEEGEDVFKGPLIETNQLMDPEEDLCAITFAKFVPGTGKEGSYVEYSESKLQAGLESALAQYNTTAQQKMELVFFTESIRHIARLTRVLGSENANALLLSLTNGTGRSALVHLASHMARCKLYAPQPTPGNPAETRRRLRSQIKRAGKTAGLIGRPAVLLIKESALGEECMQDVCCLIREGTCPDLYTGEELEGIASQMLSGAKTTPGQRNQRLEMTQERFLRTIMKNLHVIVCMDCDNHSLASLTDRVRKLPALLTVSHCVDCYLPWTQEGLSRVAQHWLKVPTRDAFTNKRIRLPWPSQFQDKRVSALCQAMAYVHRTAVTMAQRLYVQPYKFFTPRNYLDFIDLFKNLTYKITKEEKANVNRYEEALGRVNEAFSSITDYQDEIAALNPQYQMAKQRTEQIMQEVEECEHIFADARSNCVEDEKDIIALQEPLNELKKEAQAELDKVNPVYEAALHALRSLDQAALNELRTYHAPPALVCKVVNAVCLMFGQPLDWSSGKVLLNRKNFFQELEFYDKAAIPDHIYHKLNVLFIQDPTFDPEVVRSASAAASSLCMWVHAVYAYAVIHRNMRPKLQGVEEAEAKVQEAQGHLGSKRVKAQDMKGILEQKRREYQESLRQVKLCETKMQAIEARIQAAADLMDKMEAQHQGWRGSLSLAQSHLHTAPGDSLLAAACATYMGPMDESTRAVVLADWLQACTSGRYHFGAGVRAGTAMSGGVHSLAESPALDVVVDANINTHPKPTRPPHLDPLPESESPSAEVDLPPGLGQGDLINSGEDDMGSSRQERPESEVTSIVAVRDDFSVEAILGDAKELTSWKHSDSVVCDQFSVSNALFIRACVIGRRRQWPLLIDPDNQALSWIVKLQEKALASFHETTYEEEESEESLGQDGDLEEELNNPELTEDRLVESRNLESVATSNFALSRADQSSMGGEIDYGTEFPETPRTHTTMGGVTPRDNMSERDFDIHSVGTSAHSVTSHPFSVDAETVDRPFSNLWVVAADDPSLESRLIQSVVLGLGLVVTNLERACFEEGRFDDVLARNVLEGEDGERSVRIGSHMYSYNTRFALYISTSVPLELEGAGFIKPATDNFSVIDMSVNAEGLTTKLLMDVMSFERPEFANHQRSILADIREHNRALEETQLDILDKLLALGQGILEDANWSEYLDMHHGMLQTTQSHLRESLNLLAQLREKSDPYQSVAEHGTLLYCTAKKLWRLLPTYYLPLRRFLRWFLRTVESREKDRTDTASLPARAVELCNALTAEIHSQLARSLFQRHSELFVFLVAVERMRGSGEMSDVEWELFVSGLDEAVPTDRQTVIEAPSDSTLVPEWLTNEIWIKCGRLEDLVPAFQGIRQSMLRYSSQWREYFAHPPVLLAPGPPDIPTLTLCQRALLWRVVAPHRLARVAGDLGVYELGAHTAPAEVPAVGEVLQGVSRNVPLVFVLPAGYHDDGPQTGMEGHPVIDPVSDIALYCKQNHVATVIHTVSLGTQRQMERAVKALEESVEAGHWLILDNCQAVERWSEEFLLLIQHVVTPATFVEQTLPSDPADKKKRGLDDSSTDIRSQSAPSQSSIYEGLEVHPGFKLIFITTADSKSPLPGLVVQNGLQIACQTNSNFKATLRTFFNQAMAAVDQHKHMVTTTQAKSLTELVFSMALLHTVLSHRRLYHQLGYNKDYSWSISDLKAMMSCLDWGGKGESPWEHISTLRALVSQLVYAGHADSPGDAAVVDALTDSLLLPWMSLKKMPSSMGATSLVAQLVTEMSRGRRSGSSAASLVARRFQHLFDTMRDEVEPDQLGLGPSAAGLQETRASRYLAGALQSLEHCAPLHQTWYHPSLPKYLLSLDEELTKLPSLPANSSSSPSSSSESLNHLVNFISSEIASLATLVAAVRADIDLVLKAVVGEAALSPGVDAILSPLHGNTIPSSWALNGTGVPPARTMVPDWLNELRERITDLLSYQECGEKVAPCYRLGSLSQPKAFIDAVMLEHGRKEYLELHQLRIDIEITGLERIPAQPPAQGVYLSGFQLHNAQWDPKRSLIQLPSTPTRPPSTTPSRTPPSSPLPIVWLRPVVIDGHHTSKSSTTTAHSAYLCPVYGGRVLTEELSRCDALFRFDVPCTLDASVWTQKRVYATC